MNAGGGKSRLKLCSWARNSSASSGCAKGACFFDSAPSASRDQCSTRASSIIALPAAPARRPGSTAATLSQEVLNFHFGRDVVQCPNQQTDLISTFPALGM